MAGGLLVALILVVVALASTADSGAVRQAKEAARRGQYTGAWRQLGLRSTAGRQDSGTDCAARSYGQMPAFFRRMPCRSVRRKLLTLRDAHGNTARVTIAWVTMRTTADATALKRQLDTNGTGDVYAIGGVKFDGTHYASRRAGSLVVVAEAMPAGGQPAAATLDDVAAVGVEYPGP
jgi:hypothetical protein